ncbi:Ubiquinone/menaquinone biosynthesis C-methyltransferase UbiE [Halomicronema hongdechloris C2206]|uniref:Ubiquinone/menaquinone biosynthesis C-methyltransferase UbiE n=1 Tax=Halomicronema hongdechloris C2206 TaxID=1641165 RepID=A0A1Z3HS85_9CYAN|nr:class I SAM-dependent methyltransferase [Halomicronema hongdechloris]ASC73173.1 Ubiquinone/menaquinone biosynthesis C-methyltransferase UbiE [Halomicronema hongdechloris C2206]
MGLYGEIIFPRLLDWTMAGELFATYRRQVLAQAQGKVLEIGFGTGLNLAYYPEAVTHLTVIEPNRGAGAIARKRLAQSPLPVDSHPIGGEHLPMADASFDTVVSTWTLCSIAAVEQALREVYRVLKPEGRFLFIEHGQSPDPGVRRWQTRLTPVQKIIADGCHLNRPIGKLVAEVFPQVSLQEFYGNGWPQIAGYLYQGQATKPAR